MTITTSISIDQDIYFSEEYTKLKNEKKLSGLINMLLRGHFNLKKTEVSNDAIVIEEKLMQLNIERATLMKAQEEIMKAKEKEDSRWTTIL